MREAGEQGEFPFFFSCIRGGKRGRRSGRPVKHEVTLRKTCGFFLLKGLYAFSLEQGIVKKNTMDRWKEIESCEACLGDEEVPSGRRLSLFQTAGSSLYSKVRWKTRIVDEKGGG